MKKVSVNLNNSEFMKLFNDRVYDIKENLMRSVSDLISSIAKTKEIKDYRMAMESLNTLLFDMGILAKEFFEKLVEFPMYAERRTREKDVEEERV